MDEKKEMTLEENFKKLDGYIERLESQDITLEEAFNVYSQGMNVLKECNSQIDRIEKKIIVLGEDFDGEQ